MILDSAAPSYTPRDDELPPQYAPPSEFEAAQLVYNGTAVKAAPLSDVKYTHEPSPEASTVLHSGQTRAATSPNCAATIRTSDGAVMSVSTAAELLRYLQARAPPRLAARITGSINLSAFDFTLDVPPSPATSDELQPIAYLPDLVSDLSSDDDELDALEAGCAVGCIARLGGAASLKRAMEAKRHGGMPRFVHPLSLCEIATSGTPPSLVQPPVLHHSLFVDLCHAHTRTGRSTGTSAPEQLFPASARSVAAQDAARRAAVLDTLDALVQPQPNRWACVHVNQELYGWDLQRLRAGLEALIRETVAKLHNGSVDNLRISIRTVGAGDSSTRSTSFELRPDSFTTRVLFSEGWVKVLWCVCMIYPILRLCACLSTSSFFTASSRRHTRNPNLKSRMQINLAYPRAYWRTVSLHNECQAVSDPSAEGNKNARDQSPGGTTQFGAPNSAMPAKRQLDLRLIGMTVDEWLRSEIVVEAVESGVMTSQGGKSTAR